MATHVKKFVLSHRRAPGDTLVLTACVRDIKRAHPHIQLDVDTSGPDIWQNNPHLTPLRKGKKHRRDTQYLKLNYGQGIRDQNYQTVHFLQYFHRDFEKKTGLKVPVTHPTPDLHLSEAEKKPLIDGRYWVVISGGKSDFTAKVWHRNNFQAVVDGLRPHGFRFVQVGSADKGHWHPELRGVLNLVGKTNLRDLFRLIYHSDGVICGVTMAMHAAAALNRPCVVLAGGREAWWWEAYTNENRGFGEKANGKVPVPHKFLHTIGLLDCCREHGCWKNKVVPLQSDKSLCKQPVRNPVQPVPKCLDLITPAHVMEAVMGYTDASYPPISTNEPQLPAKPPEEPPKRTFLDLFSDANGQKQPANGQKQPANGQNGHAQAEPPAEPPQELKVVRKLQGRGPKHADKKPAQAPKGAVGPTDDKIFDHPTIGGKYTVFALFYGPEKYHDLRRRCLDTLLATMPKGRMELRVGSNELNSRSLSYIEQLMDQGLISLHYQHATNDRKYPVMREMFYDPDNPIETKWLLWFDDDTVCDKNPHWATLLSKAIVEHYPRGCHMFGDKYVWHMLPGQRETYRSRPWYRGRSFRMKNGKEAANGDKIIFATGGFWALSTEAMRNCDIPDPEIGHNGGDYTIGEQLWQGGYDLKQWNGKKQFVNYSSVPRRGLNEKHFGHRGNLTATA